MENAKPIKTPMPTNGHLDLNEDGKSVDQKVCRSMIGSLLYLCASRPDILLSVCMYARFQDNPKEYHLMAVKRILRYLVHTPNLDLWYPKGSTFNLLGYSDSDYTSCKVDRKSTSKTCQFLGRSLVSWSSKKQNSVALSTTEAEYVAVGACCAQLLWMRLTLRDFGLPVDPYHELPEFDDPFAEWDAMEAAEAASSPSPCAPVGSSRPRCSTRAHSPPHEEEDGDEDDNDEEEEDNDDYHNEE
ncbi:secreted RxLR effector protein 161-like [Setaria viridis]|uniref:secreted RxLR effector protein 161-like n=1 Tax=Setaria viridis TaxID=4556 RepID=UPI003B3B085A